MEFFYSAGLNLLDSLRYMAEIFDKPMFSVNDPVIKFIQTTIDVSSNLPIPYPVGLENMIDILTQVPTFYIVLGEGILVILVLKLIRFVLDMVL